MSVFRTLMIVLGALAVLTLGATAVAAETPCHSQHHAPADAPASKALKVMNCCVACVAAPRIEPPVSPGIASPAPPAFATTATVLSGVSPDPAHGPPRG